MDTHWKKSNFIYFWSIYYRLYYQLKLIVDGTQGLSGSPVGVLTSDDRDTWGIVYQKISKDSLNAQSIQQIEESLFLVSIDRPNRPLMYPKKGVDEQGVEDLGKSEKQTVAALQMIHGETKLMVFISLLCSFIILIRYTVMLWSCLQSVLN